MDLADVLADPARAQALFCWNINIAASNPRLGDLRRALEREDLLTVVLDLFQTDTADLADYVLPAASFLESDDLVCSYFHHTLSAQAKATDPPGEALPNSEIFRRLSAAVGFTEPELYDSDRDVIDELLGRSGFGISWDDLADAGTVRLYEQPRQQFADRIFPTPSGRIELASAAAVAAGQPRLPEPWHDPRPPADRLRLLSPASPWALNSTFANDPKVAHKLGPPTVTLHPEDAAARGLTDGDLAELSTPTGRLHANVVIESLAPVVSPLPQRSLAQAHRRQRERQHAQPRHSRRHGPLDQRPRHRDHHHAQPCALATHRVRRPNRPNSARQLSAGPCSTPCRTTWRTA